ncbi:hypothetical protein NSK_003996 [Nannochloropsis salina CCMP1776]|uniref:Uncharacterized protein n=1 Tax=Nannochloropsis salina CCMP1776 TaxID=1027361 RepID=A0A4D9D8J3_9STRA|nr:hypothetical protein NSK_003996 [Nannochloropsis salina CCMP1776]|eukprot:TFJ84968.1 hypothetical protein NSK_003996 [Nannochloropsis salina CCMP1776]
MASSLSSTGGKLGLASKAQTLGSCHDAENSDGCCLAGVDDRLEALAHSVSQDVIPGLERELNKVRGWLAMLDARQPVGCISARANPSGLSKTPSLSECSGESEAVPISQSELNLKVHHKLETLNTAVRVFKTALGTNYKAPMKRTTY